VAAVAVAGGAGAATTPRFVGCTGFTKHAAAGVVRPSSITVACADGNFWFSKLRWKTWSARGATASGTAHQNDCKPYCAAGHFHTYPATVTLSGLKHCAGKAELTKVSWRFTAAKPAGEARTGSQTFRCA